MIKQIIDIKGYWKIIIVYNIWLGEFNVGFTHTDFNKKRSIVGISLTTSKAQFLNTLMHEIKHVQSHICKYYNVKENSESAAYLVGYIVQQMYNNIKKIISTED